MKVSIREEEKIEQLEVVVLCKARTPFVDQLASKIGHIEISIFGKDGENTVQLPVDDIYYIEAVENRTYIYCKEKLYSCDMKLYELEDKFRGITFLRISKSCILNLNKIYNVKGMINGRLLIALDNNERLIANRSYVQKLKEHIKSL